jgi:hypothetical protein
MNPIGPDPGTNPGDGPGGVRRSDEVEHAAGRALEIQAEVLVADFEIPVPKHHAVGPADEDAVGPMEGVIDMAVPSIILPGQRQTLPTSDPIRVEIDLPPERIVRGLVIGESDVAAVADEVDATGLRKKKIDDGKDVDGLAQLPAPGPIPRTALTVPLHGVPGESEKHRIARRPAVPKGRIIGIIGQHKVSDEFKHVERIPGFILVRSHEDFGFLDQLGQQAAARMRLVENDDGAGEVAELPADGFQ